MAVLTAQDVSVGYGSRTLFSGLSFNLEARDRLGLVGRNGAGKSTLMKVLASAGGPLPGSRPPDTGTVGVRRGARIGYLPQDLLTLPSGSLLESVLASVAERPELEARHAAAEAALHAATTETAQEEWAAELSETSEALLHFDDRFGPHRAGEILTGLGFTTAEFSLPIETFSGGWRMRAALSGLLLQQPDVLFLDEPTNHLDAPTLAWFDLFVRRFPHALVLISHDRAFLNRHLRRVIAVAGGVAEMYSGNYNDYERERELRRTQTASRLKNLQDKRSQLKEFVDRFGSKATKAAAAQSKQKQIDKLDEEIAELPQAAFVRSLSFRFPEAQASGKEVMRMNGVAKRFGANVVYRDASAIVQRGERIAIVGRNGAGKTTLLRIIAKELAQDSGTIELGHNVTMAYYAQHHSDVLDAKKTIFEELDALVARSYQGATGPTGPQIRQIAGAFLFSGDDIDKRISVLSGGERARVALAKLLVVPSNVLLLDEPTNHLDLESSEALSDALLTYPGTMIFVSHNESFVERLATTLWVVEDGLLHKFPGDFTSYLQSLQGEAAPEAKAAKGNASQNKERRQLEARARDARASLIRPFKKEVEQAERAIADLESQQKAAEAKLADPEFYKSPESAGVMREFNTRREKLEKLYVSWEAAQVKLQKAEQA